MTWRRNWSALFCVILIVCWVGVLLWQATDRQAFAAVPLVLLSLWALVGFALAALEEA
jgi:hypothetical protein